MIILVKHVPVVRCKFSTVLTIVFRPWNNVHRSRSRGYPRLLWGRMVWWWLVMHSSPLRLPHSVEIGLHWKVCMVVGAWFHRRNVLTIGYHVLWLHYTMTCSFSLGDPCLCQCSPINLAWVLLMLKRLHPLLLIQRPLLPRLSTLIPHLGQLRQGLYVRHTSELPCPAQHNARLLKALTMP